MKKTIAKNGYKSFRKPKLVSVGGGRVVVLGLVGVKVASGFKVRTIVGKP